MQFDPTNLIAVNMAALKQFRDDTSRAKQELGLIEAKKARLTRAIESLTVDYAACEARVGIHDERINAIELLLVSLPTLPDEPAKPKAAEEKLNGVSPDYGPVSVPAYIKPISLPARPVPSLTALKPKATSKPALTESKKPASAKKSIGALALEVLLANNKEMTAMDIAVIVHKSNPAGHPHRTVQKWAKNISTTLNKSNVTDARLRRRVGTSGGSTKKKIYWRGVRQ